jgi:hypothetical protein
MAEAPQTGAGGAPGGPQQAPAPDHAQTVAALRHFGAITRSIVGLLKNPALGKTDMRSEVIDAMTKLVASDMMRSDNAVSEMSTFPEKPFDQRKWLEDHLMNARQGQVAVLSHHQAAFGGTTPDQDAVASSMEDNHHSSMKGLMGHYKGR